MPDDMNVADQNGEVWNVKVFGFFKYGLLEQVKVKIPSVF